MNTEQEIACPAGDLVNSPHSYRPSTGVTIEWDIMGDSRSSVSVCRSCAGATCTPLQ